jgi:hypothetical protein
MTQPPNPVVTNSTAAASETALSASALASAKPECIAWIERHPGSAFGIFLAVHFAVWTVLPTLLYANLPLDLIEGLTYGREWMIGSDKLPPLPWWLVEIMYRVFGADAAYYALAEAVIILTFAAVWATARPLVGATGALIAVLIIDGLHYFQYTAVKFNHDVVQLPFWALAGYAFHAALKRGHIGHWLLVGFAFGGALWSKYFVVILAAPYVIFLLFDRDARRALRTPGPWLGAALALIIASPHLVWLIENHFLPFAYVEVRSASSTGWFDHILHPVSYLAGQFFFMLPALCIAAVYVWPRSKPAPAGAASDFDRRIVTLLAFGPSLAMLALIAASGRGAITMWGYPLWSFVGLWIVLFVPNAIDAHRLQRVVVLWGAIFAALVVAFVANSTFLPSLDHRYRAVLFPGDRLAAELTQRFHAATGGKKLDYVIGSMWLGGNVSHYSPDHPEVLIDGLPRRAPWIELDDLRHKGAVLVWQAGDLGHLPEQFATVAPSAQVGTPFDLPPRRFGVTVEHIGWAILPPQ